MEVTCTATRALYVNSNLKFRVHLDSNVLQGIPITGLTVENVSGTVSSGGYNKAIVCGKGACSGWTWSNVNVSGGKTYGSCQNVPNPPGSC